MNILDKIDNHLNEKADFKSHATNISDTLMRLFVGDVNKARKTIKTLNTGLPVSKDVIDSGQYNKLFNKYRDRFTKLIVNMEDEFTE